MRPVIRLGTKADIPRVLTLWSRSAEPTHTDDAVSVERRTGLGRRLLEAAEARFDELGAHRSQAIVVATDHRAMIFWRNSGWDEQVERVRFVRG